MRLKKRKPRLTERRKVFLEAIKILSKYVNGSGIVEQSWKAADELMPLLDRCKHTGGTDAAYAVCSALFAMSVPQGLRTIDETHEQCVGADIFMIGYWLGRREVLRKYVFSPAAEGTKPSRKTLAKQSKATK